MSHHSYLTLIVHSPPSSLHSLSPLSFKITKAMIKESLEELLSIECEGYIESLEEYLLASPPSFLDSPPTKNIHFHPKALIDNLAIFRVSNPYPNETLEFHSNKDSIREIPKDSFKADSALISSKDTKTYQGILTFVNYLGINQESLSNLTEKNSTIKTLQYKYFFCFKETFFKSSL